MGHKSMSVSQLQIINEHHFCLSWHSLFWNSSLLIGKGYSQDTTKRQLTVCMLVNFSCLCCCLLTFFKINFFKNTISSQTIWNQIRTDFIQIVCKGYQQITKSIGNQLLSLILDLMSEATAMNHDQNV